MVQQLPLGEANGATGITRHFTVATFVVRGRLVLLLHHRKLQRWLPPGGHIEPDELPDAAARREVYEEAGIGVLLLPEPAEATPGPQRLARPEGIQLERVAPGHEHIDLIYFALPTGSTALTASPREVNQIGWYRLDELAELGVSAEIRAWAEQAVAAVQSRLGAKRTSE